MKKLPVFHSRQRKQKVPIVPFGSRRHCSESSLLSPAPPGPAPVSQLSLTVTNEASC